jgi:hypothetical protein
MIGHAGPHRWKSPHAPESDGYQWANEVGEPIPAMYDRHKIATALRKMRSSPVRMMLHETTKRISTGKGGAWYSSDGDLPSEDAEGYERVTNYRFFDKDGNEIGQLTPQQLEVCKRPEADRSVRTNRLGHKYADVEMGKPLTQVLEEETIRQADAQLKAKLQARYGIVHVGTSVDHNTITFTTEDRRQATVSEHDLFGVADGEARMDRIMAILDKELGRIDLGVQFDTDDDEFAARRKRRKAHRERQAKLKAMGSCDD